MDIRGFLNELVEAVFPSNIYCVVCGSLIDRSRPYALCDVCARQLHWITGNTCSICGKALPETYRGCDARGRPVCYDCKTRRHSFTRGFSCLTYGLRERGIMMDIKYNSKGYIARKMGDVMFDRMGTLIEAVLSEGMLPFDVVIPVPVSQKRLAKRGYNQSELMARQFVKRWKEYATDSYPVLETHVLVRQKETTMLRSLNPEERRLALHDAFAVNTALRHRITVRNVLLVDDIYTTGATADACSKVLLDAGASAVYLLTLCSGGNRRPKED